MRRCIWTATACVFLASMGCSSPPATSPSPAAASPTTAPANSGATEPNPAGTPQEVLSVLSVEHEVDVRAQREGMVSQLIVEEGAGELLQFFLVGQFVGHIAHGLAEAVIGADV